MTEWVPADGKNGKHWSLVCDDTELGLVVGFPDGYEARTIDWCSDGHATLGDAARALLLHLDPTSRDEGLTTAEIVALAQEPPLTVAAAIRTMTAGRPSRRARGSSGSSRRG